VKIARRGFTADRRPLQPRAAQHRPNPCVCRSRACF
jgi:hypothetical protein